MGIDAVRNIAVFVRVVEERSLTRAGKKLGLSSSAVSRALSRLEEHLGLRLLHRTTRSLSLTDEGAQYYTRCVHILEELETAEVALSRAKEEPRGRLRVDAPVMFGELVLAPVLPKLMMRHPALELHLSLRDYFIDPVAEGVDVLLRMAAVNEADFISRKLGECRVVTAGAPAYFERFGRPKTPGDLRAHQCMGYLSLGQPMLWHFTGPQGSVRMMPTARLHIGNSESLRQAAVAGLGLVHLFEFTLARDVKAGRLENVLESFEPPPTPIHAIYRQRRLQPPKVRAFIDFLAERMSESGMRELRVGRTS